MTVGGGSAHFSLVEFPAEILLLVADHLPARDLFNLQQTCQYTRTAFRAKMWQDLEILTTMEDETVGEALIGEKGHIQIGNINVKSFIEQVSQGHFDHIFPYIKHLTIVEETPFNLAEALDSVPETPNFDSMDEPETFAYLFQKLITRERLPLLTKITLDRVLLESVQNKETVLNRIISERFSDVDFEFVLHPSYGLKWFSDGDRYLFNKLTNIECYTTANIPDESILTFERPLPSTLETFSLQSNVTIDTKRFEQLFKQCVNLTTLNLDISKVLYLESVNWIPCSVTDLFIHVADIKAEPPSTGVKKIVSTSVERLALDGNFWSVLPTLRFPNLRCLDLSVMVDEHGIPEEVFCKNVSNVLMDSRLQSVVVNFAIDGLPLMIPVGTASTVTNVRVSNNWRQHYDRTIRNTSMEAMQASLKHFPKLKELEVAMSGLKTEGQLAYILHMTSIILKSRPGLTVRFLAVDMKGIKVADDLFAVSTMFTRVPKNGSFALELDRVKLRSVYKLGSLDRFRSALVKDKQSEMADFMDIIELVLAGY